MKDRPGGGERPSLAPRPVAGQGPILRPIRSLPRRVERFGLHRVGTREDQRWAARLAGRLEASFTGAPETQAVRAGPTAAVAAGKG